MTTKTQLIETTNKFTGDKSYKEVSPERAFEFLNHQRRLWQVSSARLVAGQEADRIRKTLAK